mmetsp:Transcript_6977/g.17254  ORF Transcript_6977/g.17254 Transcript_6977/m.17254 type:complete len:91 (+) Transcript_6977:395-667(+)
MHAHKDTQSRSQRSDPTWTTITYTSKQVINQNPAPSGVLDPKYNTRYRPTNPKFYNSLNAMKRQFRTEVDGPEQSLVTLPVQYIHDVYHR